MGTLSVCVPYIKGSFLLLESDLIYDINGLSVLINFVMARRANLVNMSEALKTFDQ